MGIQGEKPPTVGSRINGALWTDEQQSVIEAGASDRILVDAGPGTGKTATACARIAWLIKSGGLEASAIWLISFTRTAVHELRGRIASSLREPAAAAALRVATIDAHAWAIHSGFDQDASLSGAFDDNIDRVIQMVRSHDGVFEYLSNVDHLVVDEAQDVVGSRCELLLEIIHALPRTAGVSIFSDEAQSIYGFAEDAASGNVQGTLPEKIREFMADDFQELELTHVHRTTDKTLLQVFGQGRRVVRDCQQNGAARLSAVKDLISQANHGSLGLYRDDIAKLPADLEDAFLLFRRRGEVLDASGYLGLRPHRLRMSGLPTCVHGWISVVFWDWSRPDMDLSEFEQRWARRVNASGNDAAYAWSLLFKAFGRSVDRISVTKMVTRLASGSPSYELTLPEFGSVGPVVGTIHGSKGREAREVRLYLPPSPSGNADDALLDEEARIVFVGATRARACLQVGKAAPRAIAKRLGSSGRAFTPYFYERGSPSARAAVEVGRVRDIDAAGLVGVSLYESAHQAKAAQQRVMDLKAGMAHARAAITDAASDWRYEVLNKDSGERLCYLATGINNDLFGIASIVDDTVRLGKRRPPSQLNHLRTFGVRTLVLAPDDPARELLHAPWRDSGVIAAPMLIGYPIVYFRWGG